MKIYLYQITDQETELDFTETEKWVADAVARVDEVIENDSISRGVKPSAERPISTHLSLRKVDEVIVVSGDVKTQIQLICSRCAVPYRMKAEPQFSALFCKDPVMAGVAHREISKDGGETGRLMGQNQGHARHAHNYGEDHVIAAGQDLDITYLSQDYVDLADVLTEQLQFQVPFQPLCKEDCKGICTQCGADLNVGRCACAKIASSQAFSVLKDFKPLKSEGSKQSASK